MISMTCGCKAEFWVRDRVAGQVAKCPSCQGDVAVPALEVVRATMSPATCSCGEVFWSAQWRAGRRVRCPLCGQAVVAAPSMSGTTLDLAAAATATGSDPQAATAPAKPAPPGPGPAPGAGPMPAVAAGHARRLGGRPALLGAGVAAALVLVAAVALALRTGGEGDADEGQPGGPPTRAGESVGAAPAPPVAPGAAQAARLGLLVPAYFYPAGPGLEDWQRLIRAAARVPVVAVVNPSSGPGLAVVPDYAEVIRRAGQAGVTTIGYVTTRYAERPASEVEAEIDRWVRLYPEIKGIFLDNQSTKPEHVGYYAGLRDYVRAKIAGGVAVTNPGAVPDEAYLSRRAVDTAVIFEVEEGFKSFRMPSWSGRYEARRFAALPYGVADAEAMRDAIRETVVKEIGHLFVTDGALPNPWDHLPDYWDDEVEAVAAVNERRPL